MDGKEFRPIRIKRIKNLLNCWRNLVTTLFINRMDFLFDSGKTIFTPEVLEGVIDRYINNPDRSKDSHGKKADRQFRGASDEEKMLFQHALYIYLMIFITDKRGGRKVDTKKKYLECWDLGSLSKSVELTGVSLPGTYYATNPGRLIPFIIRLFQHIMHNEHVTQNNIMQKIEEYCVNNKESGGISNAILFYVNPNRYERIISNRHKENIAERYRHLIEDLPQFDPNNIDACIALIKQKLIKRDNDPNMDFYEKRYKQFWDPSSDQYGESNAESIEVHEFNDLSEEENPNMNPLNTIFVGPPGTGKTREAMQIAVKIICDTMPSTNENTAKQFQELQESKRIQMVTFHQNYAYEDFIEGIRPVLGGDDNNVSYELKDGIFKKIALRAASDPNQNHVLIIDEINRGNIAKIFGELITLIEESKRHGNPEALTLTLPYSQEEFTVPNNLHIIGTMNTADRSIALLDTALRRRFTFKEIMPAPSLLPDITTADGTTLSLKDVLTAINTRIHALYDRDHQIGHAYLIHVKTMDDLKQAFQHKILPLLQEYFFDNWHNINLILNKNGFIKKTEFSLDGEQKTLHGVTDHSDPVWTTPANYAKIYKDHA